MIRLKFQSTLICFFALFTIGYAGITIQPAGLANRVEAGDTLHTGMTLSNDLNEDVVYSIKLIEIDHQDNRMNAYVARPGIAPKRDRRGEPDDAGYFWVDNNEDDGPQYQWEDILNRDGAQRLNLGDDGNSGELDLGFEFPWYGEWYTNVRVCTNGWFAFGPDEDAVTANLPECPNQNAPNNIVAVECYDFVLQNQASITFWTDGEGTAVISWVSMMMAIVPVRQNITFQAIISAETGTVKLQYGLQNGVQNNLLVVGYENQDGSLGSSYSFHQGGIAQGLAIAITGPFSKWLEIDPMSGQIEANSDFDLDLTLLPEDLDAGTYEMIMGVTSIVNADQDDSDTSYTEVSVVMTVDNPTYSITGEILTELGGDPISGATISLDSFLISRTSDEAGDFEFTDLPDGMYHLTVNANDYLPQTVEVQIDGGDEDVSISLFQAELSLNHENVMQELAPDGEATIGVIGTNIGNGPLTYTVDRRLIGDANAAPWELRRDYEVGNILEDDRIEGVAFDGENFYLAGANGNDPNTIYILDREGDPVGEFVQPGESRYGMKDLEWDGDLLWGGADQDGNVIGFDTEGNVAHSFRGPFNPTNNIAYDPVNEILWLSGTTTNIAGYTREGQATGVVLNRRNLRIYGLAYWPDDPDGYPLYILNQPAANVMVVHKMNPANGDTLRVRNIEALQDASPGGAFICNTFDVYSWVMMFTNNVGANLGGDRNYIYQLDARKEWFMVEPVEGMIDAGESQEFDLHLNAAGLPAVTFEGELLFTHDGVGSATILPIRLDVVEGPVHSQRNLQLGMGWNLVSANLQPDEEDIVTVTQGLADAGNLIRVKDGRGNFYDVNSGFSNLEGWNVAEGYWLKVLEPSELRVEGITVMSDDPIGLEAGWQTVAYYPRRAVDALIALSGIANELQIAKDGVGNFYLPGYGYSNIGAMSEGHGYQLKVTEATELVYRTRLDGMNPASFADRGLSVYDAPGRYAVHTPTGRNMSLLVKSDLADGTDVGVYAGDVLVGSGIIRSGVAGVAVWGDDPSTPTVDGAIEGDALTIRLRDDSGEREASTTLLQGELTYLTDGVVVAGVTATTMPVEFGLTNAYPNPFNNATMLKFALAVTGKVSLTVFDLSGREVASLVSGEQQAGSYNAVWNAQSVPSGVYLVRLQSGSISATRKVVLMR